MSNLLLAGYTVFLLGRTDQLTYGEIFMSLFSIYIYLYSFPVYQSHAKDRQTTTKRMLPDVEMTVKCKFYVMAVV